MDLIQVYRLTAGKTASVITAVIPANLEAKSIVELIKNKEHERT